MEDLTKNQTKNSGDRMGVFHIKQTGEFSEERFGNSTAEQVRDFKKEKNEETFDEKLTAFSNEQTGILSESPNVDLNNKQLFEDFINKPMRDSTKEQVGTLSKEQTREFRPIQSKNVDEERMKDLTDTHLGEFTDERIEHFRKTLNYEQLFGDCTKGRMKGLTKERMGKLTPKHARNFYEELVGDFDENQMNDFTEKQIENFTEEQTVDFTEKIGDSTEEKAQVQSICKPEYTSHLYPCSAPNSYTNVCLCSVSNSTVTDLYDNLLEAAADHLPLVKTVPPAPAPPVVPMRSKKLL